MSNTEPAALLPPEPIVSGNTTDYGIVGNPNLIERIQIHAEANGVQTVSYGYVDASTNTFVHSHQMELRNKRADFL